VSDPSPADRHLTRESTNPDRAARPFDQPALPDRLGRVAMIARWKPVHVGHAAVLEALVERADVVLIGIGSSNRYDAANPFSAAETEEMIRAVLHGRTNFDVVDVPDLGHGPSWRAMVVAMLGALDVFVTANPYVRQLLAADYRVVHPVRVVPTERRVPVDGTLVRKAMARGEDWRPLVPDVVAHILDERGLVERFRRDFGLETLALDAPAAP
jgi:nicotinamide-nucleotide adenylyltransferase